MSLQRLAAVATIIATGFAALSFFQNRNSGSVVLQPNSPLAIVKGGTAYASGDNASVTVNNSVTVIDNSIIATGNSSVNSVVIGSGAQVNINTNQELQ